MILLVGLGNPGAKYAGNRHNIGFMALDAIAARNGFGPWRRKFQGEVAEGLLGGVKTVALKPLTYMNESGQSVGEAMRFLKLTPADVIVMHDELDLAPAKVRTKLGGGHAGHNGLRSIQAHIGADFHRLRLGIGHPGAKELVHAWVLNDFAKADKPWLDALIDAIASHAGLLADGKGESFVNKIHLAVDPVIRDTLEKEKP